MPSETNALDNSRQSLDHETYNRKQLMAPNRPSISIIVPTLREAPNIPILVSEITLALAETLPRWELVIVDDNSNDGTLEICEALRRQGVALELIVRKRTTGLSTAVLRGFECARAAVFVVMDGDLSHPADTIHALYRAIENGADFALGSRYLPEGSTDDKWTVYRLINSTLATWLSRPLVSVSDPMSGFFAIPRSLWDRCDDLSPVGYKIGLELMVKGRPANLQEIPIAFRTRIRGKSKLTLRQQWLYLRHLYSLYGYRWAKRKNQ